MSIPFKSSLAANYVENAKPFLIDGVQAVATFSTLEDEYKSIRERVAISDQSHFSKFQITGHDAVDFLSFINLPDIARLPIGNTASSFMLTEDGGVFCECYIVFFGGFISLVDRGKTRADVNRYLESHLGSFKCEDQRHYR